MKILYISTIGITMGFFKQFIQELIKEGHQVDIACNNSVSDVPEVYKELKCKIYTISCSRSVFDVGNLKAINEIRKIVSDNHYDIVHCHTPIAAACTRIACRKKRKSGTKVIYTAHGFHFYKGAPIKNWVFFYPMEKLCAHFTDVLITINKEDYQLAKKKMGAKKVEYVPGVGVDVERFKNTIVDKEDIRHKIDIPIDAQILLSVGELNENKNHKTVIKAMEQLKNKDVHYVVVGEGNLKEKLIDLSKKCGIEDRIHFLGYRTDVNELCKCADVFCFPSYREGLGIAAIEAMAAGLPLITSDVHGINDYSEEGVTGYKCRPNDVEGFVNAISLLVSSEKKRIAMGKMNIERAERYDIKNIIPIMKCLYKG